MLRLRAARLLDGKGSDLLLNAAVLIDGDRILAVGPDADLPPSDGQQVIDLGDATLLPGLIDAHMHTFGLPSTGLGALLIEREAYRALRAAGELRRLLQAGFTSARCLGSSIGPDLRRAIAEGHVPGPRLVAAGEFICSTSGTWDSGPTPLSLAKERGLVADGIDGVRNAVRTRVRVGADFIKLGLSKGGVGDRYHAWGDDPYRQVTAYSLEEVQAATDEAHRNGLKVSAHCIGDAPVRLALDGGVDIIEHGYGITAETRQRLVDSGKIVVTTIAQLFFHRAAYAPFHYPQWEIDAYERHWAAMRHDFTLGYAAGIRYALGTDLVGEPTHPLAVAAKEFELAVAWGMRPADAIKAGTTIAAEALGIAEQTGSIEVRKLADIIAVAGNPLDDIAVLQRPSFILKGGQGVEPLS
ncbi:amidohydrolase family protein [Acidisoma cellulosilytica]|uniref:Amidohydrolase family protein n=1 Tax=Acidisoma cellulosilyticum TaxID=2802395 RepID=A0A963Z6T7_9PROT|nr:amidohydrolase family protein [Acidisoma cellulosilyticum]MCB8883599.1 amidohydrolase family protein [Acidisoma cellulosilyticum]